MSAPIMATPSKGGTVRYRPMSEINVTPFVDVMLVLLVVFMVTAPLLTVGVEIDLPKAESEPLLGEDEPLTVTIDAAGQLFLQKSAITLDELGPKLLAISGENPDARIFLRGDQAVGYGRVMQVMSAINMAGFTRVALVTENPLEVVAGAEG